MKARFALLLAACAAAMFLMVSPAGAAPSPVGHVTVSNPSPDRASAIEVTSRGWRPGAVVSISLSGSGVLGHATADAGGAVRTRVSIPNDAPRYASLAVIGAASSGVPQQITTNLLVAGRRNAPAPQRPWTAVYLILAIATGLLLASVRSERVPAPAGLAAAPS